MVNLPSGRATHHDCKHEYPRLAEPYETTKSNPVWSSTTSEIVGDTGLEPMTSSV